MNVNCSPPRKGFFVIPNEKILRLSLLDVKSAFDSCFSSPLRNRHNEVNFLSLPSRELDFCSDDKFAKLPNVKPNKKKKNSITRPVKANAKTNYASNPICDEKRVWFHTNKNGDIITEQIPVNLPNDLTKEDIQSGWWSKKELSTIKKRSIQFCRQFLSIRHDYKHAVIRMLVRCGAEKKEEILDIDFNLEHTETEEDEDLSTIIDGIHRGLEKRMILTLNLPFQNHKKSVSVVLDVQSRLRSIDPEYFTADQKIQLIAAQYAVNTQYAKEWAKRMALGDSACVARNFQFDW